MENIHREFWKQNITNLQKKKKFPDHMKVHIIFKNFYYQLPKPISIFNIFCKMFPAFCCRFKRSTKTEYNKLLKSNQVKEMSKGAAAIAGGQFRIHQILSVLFWWKDMSIRLACPWPMLLQHNAWSFIYTPGKSFH